MAEKVTNKNKAAQKSSKTVVVQVRKERQAHKHLAGALEHWQAFLVHQVERHLAVQNILKKTAAAVIIVALELLASLMTVNLLGAQFYSLLQLLEGQCSL